MELDLSTDERQYALQLVVSAVAHSIARTIDCHINGEKEFEESLEAVTHGDERWADIRNVRGLVIETLPQIYADLKEEFPDGIATVKKGELNYTPQKRFTKRLPWVPTSWNEQAWDALVILAPPEMV